MLNVLGLLLIAAASSGCGILYALKLRTRVRVIESLTALIGSIRVEIETYRTPLHLIYQSCSDETLDRTGILDSLRIAGFSGSIPRIRGYAGLETAEVLERFSGQLGKTCAKEQILTCSLTEERLRAILKKEKETLPSRMKLCTTVGICCGIMLDIVLI